MLLELVIIYYKSHEKYLKNLLASISLQQDIDFDSFKCIFVNDGDDEFDKKVLENQKFKIDYYKIDHKGISYARQYGLERANSDYIMFCDGDDMFMRMNALWDIMNRLNKDRPDILTSKFSTDMCNKKGTECRYFQDYNNDNVWIHGKAFSTKFLKDHNIKWNENLLLYEDSYFVRLCFAMNPKKINIDECTYFWKFRPDSITRSDPDFEKKTYCEKMDSNAALVKQFLDRKMMTEASNYAFVQIYECYLTLTCWSFEDALKEYKEKIERYFVGYWKSYSWLLCKLNYENACAMMNVLHDRYYRNPQLIDMTYVTFREFKDSMMRKYGDSQKGLYYYGN